MIPTLEPIFVPAGGCERRLVLCITESSRPRDCPGLFVATAARFASGTSALQPARIVAALIEPVNPKTAACPERTSGCSVGQPMYGVVGSEGSRPSKPALDITAPVLVERYLLTNMNQ